MKVYRKESKFKDGDKYWYSGTNSENVSCRISFDASIKDQIPDKPAFVIKNIMGNAKYKEVENEETGEIYNNAVYYVKSCTFEDMPVEALAD